MKRVAWRLICVSYSGFFGCSKPRLPLFNQGPFPSEDFVSKPRLVEEPGSNRRGPIALRVCAQVLSLFSCLLFAGVGGIQAATHVQQASNSDITSRSYTSFSATFTAATTSGNAIILGITYGSTNPTITVTDSQGNTYVQAIKKYDSEHRQGSAILYATNITGGASTKVTVKFSASVAYLAVGIHEYNGIAPTSALDAASGQIGNGSALSSGLATTMANGDLIFGCVVEDATGQGDRFSPGSGFSKRVDQGNAAAYADEDQVQILAGSIAATWTLAPASNWIAAMAAFKASTGGGVTAPSLTNLSPNSGSVGTSVTIAGANFGATQGTSTVTFNGALATPTSWNPTSIAATVPNGAATGNVVVTVGGQASNAVSFAVTSAAPSVTNLSPNSGSVGTSVTIAGANFGATRGTSTVTFNGALATPTSWSPTRIVATVPNGATTGNVTITVSNQTSNGVSFSVMPITVFVSPATINLPVGQSASVTASLQNDALNKGASWNLSGSGCSGSACGMLTSITPTSVTYTAPATVPSSATVTLRATSVADNSKQAATIITVKLAPPPITVAASPASASVQVGTTAQFSATVQNDPSNQGVLWKVNGVAGGTPAFGTISLAGLYQAPSGVPSPVTFPVSAVSQADNSKAASAMVTVALGPPPPPISVSVSPASVSVQVSQSANFTASLQNDSQNQGVTWSLSGAGCSGATCGTLADVTTASVTYNAPATAPGPAGIILTATSIADSTNSAPATIALTQAPEGTTAAIPTFADNHVSGSINLGDTARYVLRLPNRTQRGNCIIVGFQYSAAPGVTASISDDQGNTYSPPVRNSDGNQIVNLAYALNVAAGTQKITIAFSGGTTAYVSGLASEFYDVAISNALDGSSHNSGTDSSVTAGTLVPVASGDLIYQYAVQDSTSDPMISWTQGASPWTLLSADVLDSTVAQYQVQASAAPLNPTLSMAPAQNFNSVAIALKSATAGSAPPPGIRVVRVQHSSVPRDASSPVRLQFPCTGNLLVVAWIGVAEHRITSITDALGNAYASTGPALGSGTSGDNQIYYAAAATTSTTMMGPNLTTIGNDISGSTAILFDVSGAAASPYDSVAGRATASGTQTSAGSVTGASITPSTANGLVISSIGVDSNTVSGVSPGNFLSGVPAPVPSPNPVDQNNGWALNYNTDTSPETFVWNTQDGAVNNWATIAVAFKAAP